MAASSKTPFISVIIPTLNSGNVLFACLKSIRAQKYNQNRIEIIIADGGSTDQTINIANKYKCIIIKNKLKTAEAGKSIGVKSAKGDFIALIDSDNILPNSHWLNIMMIPFRNKSIIGTEPWKYTYRRTGGYIERYSALTGVNDPYALIANNYDRLNYLNKTWNGLNIHIDNHRYYQSFSLNQRLPTIGANGTIYRKSIISRFFKSSYLIDIDLPYYIAKLSDTYLFAKVKCGIIHTFCESSIAKFYRKQQRRVIDLYIYQNKRPQAYISSQTINAIKFSLYVLLIFPMLFHTVKGYIKKPDPAWLFHPLACLITFFIYTVITIKYHLHLLNSLNRNSWHQ